MLTRCWVRKCAATSGASCSYGSMDRLEGHMKRTSRTFVVFAAVIMTIVAPVVACLWDYDTLRAEARGVPGVAEIITGRFERNPPLYYEMRLEQSSLRISRNAHDW